MRGAWVVAGRVCGFSEFRGSFAGNEEGETERRERRAIEGRKDREGACVGRVQDGQQAIREVWQSSGLEGVLGGGAQHSKIL
jgi:hypothetical protein